MKLRMVLITALLFSTFANAEDYTDIWFNPAESGWGVNVVQSDTFQFLTFFIYGQDSKPTWYTAQLTKDGTGTYSGPLYETNGTYFAAPWQGVTAAVVGTASFQPTSSYNAALTYTLSSGPTVTKTIQRQALTGFQMAGSYSGSVSGSISGCINTANDVPVLRHRFDLSVTQSGDASATLMFTLVENSAVCTFSGALTHLGREYRMVKAAYRCGTNPPIAANVEELQLTVQGIEGRWTADDGDGCMESIRFGAVLN
jgi:hypothetical protein